MRIRKMKEVERERDFARRANGKISRNWPSQLKMLCAAVYYLWIG